MIDYIADLLKLDQNRPLTSEQDSRLKAIVTPLVLQDWESMLTSHPDRVFSNYLLSGMSHGLRVGFNRSFPLRSVKCNMRSAIEHPKVVSQYLGEEVKAGQVLGPLLQGGGRGCFLACQQVWCDSQTTQRK